MEIITDGWGRGKFTKEYTVNALLSKHATTDSTDTYSAQMWCHFPISQNVDDGRHLSLVKYGASKQANNLHTIYIFALVVCTGLQMCDGLLTEMAIPVEFHNPPKAT